MLKKLVLALILIIPVGIFSQDAKKSADEEKHAKPSVSTNIPVESQYSNKFEIKSVDFNRKIDLSGKGEVLEVQIIMNNLTDDPLDIYLFTVATYEKVERTKSSLEMPIPEKERIRNIVPFPFNLKNFEYEATDVKGNPLKDEKGNPKTKYLKFPRNSKEGVDPETSKPYHLDVNKRLVVRTYHLSPYKKNYVFFNNLALHIFDAEGKPLYRKYYKMTAFRK